MPRSRRALLQAVAAGLGGGLASVAGCLGRSGSQAATADGSTADGSTADDSTAETATAPGTAETSAAAGRSAAVEFDRWLPDPTTTAFPDGYGFRYFDVDGVRERRDAMHENAYERLRRQMLRPVRMRGVDPADVDATLRIDFVLGAAFGSFDPDAVAAALTGDRDGESQTTATSSTATRSPTTATRTPWPEPERYGEFDLYGRERVYAVSPDAVIAVTPMVDGDALDYAKAFVDAASAGADRYPDGNEYVASLLDLVESPDALWCYPEAMDGSTSRGFRADDITGQLKAWDFGSESARLTFANTYVDRETAASGELRRYLGDESERFGPYDGLDVSVEGRLAWTDGTAPISDFDHLAPGGPADGVTTAN